MRMNGQTRHPYCSYRKVGGATGSVIQAALVNFYSKRLAKPKVTCRLSLGAKTCPENTSKRQRRSLLRRSAGVPTLVASSVPRKHVSNAPNVSRMTVRRGTPGGSTTTHEARDERSVSDRVAKRAYRVTGETPEARAKRVGKDREAKWTHRATETPEARAERAGKDCEAKRTHRATDAQRWRPKA